MKVLYVGDNRNRLNWGCRSTSKALQSLLLKKNEIIATIDGKEVDNGYTRIIKHPLILPKFQKKIWGRQSNIYSKLFYKFIELTGKQTDYIEENIDRSIKFLERNHQFYPHLSNIYNSLDACDAVVINGEGDMIFTNPPRRNALFYLMLIKLAQKKGKKTFYMNAMISDPPIESRNEKTINQMLNVFSGCDFVSVRDPQSYRVLSEIDKKNQINFEYIPDALFTWSKYFINNQFHPPVIGDSIIPWPEEDKYFNKFNFSKPYICISGSSSAAWNQNKAKEGYIELVNKIKGIGIQVYLVPTCVGDSFLNAVGEITNTPVIPIKTPILLGASILANAELFISGRFHPSILASLGGVPCIFLKSNSHKTLSLQEMLNYTNPIEYNDIPTHKDINEIFEKAISILHSNTNFRIELKKRVEELSKMANKVTKIVQ